MNFEKMVVVLCGFWAGFGLCTIFMLAIIDDIQVAAVKQYIDGSAKCAQVGDDFVCRGFKK